MGSQTAEPGKVIKLFFGSGKKRWKTLSCNGKVSFASPLPLLVVPFEKGIDWNRITCESIFLAKGLLRGE